MLNFVLFCGSIWLLFTAPWLFLILCVVMLFATGGPSDDNS